MWYHTRLTGMEMLESLILGVLFSTVLIWTSRFEVKDDNIYMKRSKAFPIILISLLIIRTVIKIFISSEIDPGEIAGMFFTRILYDSTLEMCNAL